MPDFIWILLAVALAAAIGFGVFKLATRANPPAGTGTGGGSVNGPNRDQLPK